MVDPGTYDVYNSQGNLVGSLQFTSDGYTGTMYSLIVTGYYDRTDDAGYSWYTPDTSSTSFWIETPPAGYMIGVDNPFCPGSNLRLVRQ